MAHDDFKLLTTGTYLANCSHSPVYQGILDSLESYKKDLLEFGNPWDIWSEKIREIKILLAKLIHASADEIAPHFSVSSALGALLSSFDYSAKNELVISDLEYPTSNHVFLGQQKLGAKVLTINNRHFSLSLEDYERIISDKTKLVSAFHVSSLNGFTQEIKEISELVHSAGSEVYVDAYQSIGNMDVDVKKMGVDYLAAGTLKYLLGLPGFAFLYVRKDLIESLEPSYIGWFSQTDPFEFGAKKLNYSKTADRFQSGTWAIPSIYASIAGIRTILNLGIETIRKRISKLTEQAIRLGSELNLETITPEDGTSRGAIVSFLVNNPHAIEMTLRKERIFTASRSIGIRLAPHFYNVPEDIELAVNRIHELNKRK